MTVETKQKKKIVSGRDSATTGRPQNQNPTGCAEKPASVQYAVRGKPAKEVAGAAAASNGQGTVLHATIYEWGGRGMHEGEGQSNLPLPLLLELSNTKAIVCRSRKSSFISERHLAAKNEGERKTTRGGGRAFVTAPRQKGGGFPPFTPCLSCVCVCVPPQLPPWYGPLVFGWPYVVGDCSYVGVFSSKLASRYSPFESR